MSTIAEKVLIAAKSCNQPFKNGQLVLAAWKQYPETFSLADIAESLPDSNKVLSYLMGAHGLRSRGYIAQTAKSTYTVTPAGSKYVAELLGEELPASTGAVQLSREQVLYVERCLNADAVRKFNAGNKANIYFSEASKFWGLQETGEAGTQLAQHRQKLLAVESVLEVGDAVLPSGKRVSVSDVHVLLCVSDYLEGIYERRLHADSA